MEVTAQLGKYEKAMRSHFAALDLDHWWPARTQFEMIAGALLVQNTNWGNVQMAIRSLRAAGKLSLAGVRSLSEAELGRLIRSAGAWRQKARRLRAFVLWLDDAHAGSLPRFFAQPTERARQQLLALEGFGEETADAILTFAGGHARFISDAYTRRIFVRHRLSIAAARQTISQPRACRDWHALLVETAKHYCRKQAPDCTACPLGGLLP